MLTNSANTALTKNKNLYIIFFGGDVIISMYLLPPISLFITTFGCPTPLTPVTSFLNDHLLRKAHFLVKSGFPLIGYFILLEVGYLIKAAINFVYK